LGTLVLEKKMRTRSTGIALSLLLSTCLGLQVQPAPSRPRLIASSSPSPRSSVHAALPPLPPLSSTANLLAALPGLGEGYGGTSAFSQSASGQTGDLNYVVLLAVLFPTIVTAFFFKDSIAEAFGPPPPEEIPAGWRKENSQSRPGKFSYVNIKTKERYDRLPNWAGKE
tara:strand:- start:589 stop:1095 length:507 start_codon:yes stop_codon:yes gene_type:complete